MDPRKLKSVLLIALLIAPLAAAIINTARAQHAPAYISVYGFKVYDFGYGGINLVTQNHFIVVDNTVFLLFVHNDVVYYSATRDLMNWIFAPIAECVSCTFGTRYWTQEYSHLHVIPINKTHYIVLLFHDFSDDYYKSYLGRAANLTILVVKPNTETLELEVVSSTWYDLSSSQILFRAATLINGTVYAVGDNYVLAVNTSDWSIEIFDIHAAIPDFTQCSWIDFLAADNVDGLLSLVGLCAVYVETPSGFTAVFRMMLVTYNGSVWRYTTLVPDYDVDIVSIQTAVINRTVLIVYVCPGWGSLCYAVVDPFSFEVVDSGKVMDISAEDRISPMLIKDRYGYVIALIPAEKNNIYMTVYSPYSRSWTTPIRAAYISRNIVKDTRYEFGSAYPTVIENGDPYILAAVMTWMNDANFIHIITANVDYTYPILVLPTSPTLSPTTLPPPQPWAPPLMLVLFILMLALGVGGLIYILARR